ncbi:MAG: EamA family transporter [Candidatus Pacebacteria bacterium]|nr:EamA family transporter [Candidatus Paceibacterota bacterium]
MHWFLFALINPVLHAAANHIDKHLISKYFKSGSVGALVIFTAIFALFALPIIWLIHPAITAVSPVHALILVLNGTLALGYVILYLYALEKDEASIIAPFFQMIPIFAFILGFFILKELPSAKQIVAGLLIICGAITLSLDFSGAKIKFKKAVVQLMLASSLLLAVNGVIFKFIALNEGFLTSLFWGMLGQIILGILLFLFVTSYKKQFIQVVRQNTLPVLGLNFLNGLIILMGDVALNFAILLAPVSLVLAVSGFQPLFVFIFGILLTFFYPAFGKESFERKVLAQKIAGIAIIILGSVLIN